VTQYHSRWMYQELLTGKRPFGWSDDPSTRDGKQRLHGVAEPRLVATRPIALPWPRALENDPTGDSTVVWSSSTRSETRGTRQETEVPSRSHREGFRVWGGRRFARV